RTTRHPKLIEWKTSTYVHYVHSAAKRLVQSNRSTTYPWPSVDRRELEPTGRIPRPTFLLVLIYTAAVLGELAECMHRFEVAGALLAVRISDGGGLVRIIETDPDARRSHRADKQRRGSFRTFQPSTSLQSTPPKQTSARRIARKSVKARGGPVKSLSL